MKWLSQSDLHLTPELLAKENPVEGGVCPPPKQSEVVFDTDAAQSKPGATIRYNAVWFIYLQQWQFLENPS